MSDQGCLTPTCLTDRQVKEAVLTTKMNTIVALCITAVGLLSYSVFWQAPVMRAEVAKEINRLDNADRDIKSEIKSMDLRISALEEK